MTNAKVHLGFRHDKKVEKLSSTFNTSSNIEEKKEHRVVWNNILSEVDEVIAIDRDFCLLKVMKCRRRHATDPQKLKNRMRSFHRFLLVEAEAVDEITVSLSLMVVTKLFTKL